jgi:hypothetical protein
MAEEAVTDVTEEFSVLGSQFSVKTKASLRRLILIEVMSPF